MSKQVELFKGVSVSDAVAKAFAVTNKVSKNGNRTVVACLPRKSKTKDDLADASGFKGQELMAFEAQARKELAESWLKQVSGLIMTGDYTFGRCSLNNKNGAITTTLRRATMRVAVVTTEAALKALGLTQAQYDAVIAATPAAPGQS